MDMEELMINRLKDVCGYDFTSKLHSMYLDIRMSAENTKKFHESLQAGDSLNTTMNANILQVNFFDEQFLITFSAFLCPFFLLKSYFPHSMQ